MKVQFCGVLEYDLDADGLGDAQWQFFYLLFNAVNTAENVDDLWEKLQLSTSLEGIDKQKFCDTLNN